MTSAFETGTLLALFAGLLIYVLRDAHKREKKYLEMITELHEDLTAIKQIRENISKIQRTLREKNNP